MCPSYKNVDAFWFRYFTSGNLFWENKHWIIDWCWKVKVIVTQFYPALQPRHPVMGEPDILEFEVKWALGSITMNKASGGDAIPVELFQILKDDAVKVLHSICQQIWKNSTVAAELENVSFHSNHKERQCQRMFKLLYNFTHLTS